MNYLQEIMGRITSKRASKLVGLLNEYKEKYGKFKIVETGTIRNASSRYKKDDGHSTKYICEFIQKNPDCTFCSIDLQTNVCNTYLKEKNLRQYVNLIQGNSLDVLPTLTFDIAYLDSDNDSELIFKEFTIALEKKAKLIIVDDVDPTNPELKKGIKVMEYLDAHKLVYQLLPRQLVFWNNV